MKKSAITFGLALLLFCQMAMAQVSRSQITTAIENREPVDSLQGDVAITAGETKTLYLFSHMENLAGKQVIHRWFYKDREMATVNLNIGSNNWRTYSSKRILSTWQGPWKVQIWHQDLLLTEHTFNIVDL